MIDLQKILNGAVKKEAIVGAVAMIGSGETVFASAAAGFSDPVSKRMMAIDDIFQIASLTKAVTSVAAMQLVERGILSLNEPIDNVLPELANPKVIEGFDRNGNAQLRPAKNAITLKHLLTHTSGFGYPFTSAEMAKAQGDVVPATIASISSPLVFEPGTDWLYGVSTDWAGRAIEVASGQKLGDYMEEHILAPLAMHDTGFSISSAKAKRKVSLLFRNSDNFVPFPVEIGGGETAEFQSGGSGLYSTAVDFMRFMQMILNEGAVDDVRILNAASVAVMSQNQIGSLRAGHLESVTPELSEMFDNFPGMNTKWGLGFLINPQKACDGRAAGSLSWAGLANCYYWIDPASDIAGLVLMQFLPFGDKKALNILSAVEAAAYNS